MMATEKGFFTPGEAAKALFVDIRTIYTWLREGTLPGRQIGGRWRIAVETITDMQRLRTEKTEETS